MDFNTITVEQLVSHLSDFIQKDRLYSPAEACKLFQPSISVQTLKKWTDAGLIPMQRLGGRIFYRYGNIVTAGANLNKYSRNNRSDNE
jgi:hypothetical protein